MISAGTAFRAAVRGLPLKIVAYSFKQPLFYLLAQPAITSIKELKGKKIAVSSPQDTGGLAAKAAIQTAGLDPERDVTYISIGAASVRFAAMEVGSVEAAIMPVPWNSRMKQKGFRELIFAGGLMPQPMTGIVTAATRLEKNPDQVKRVLRGYLRSLRAFTPRKTGSRPFHRRTFQLGCRNRRRCIQGCAPDHERGRYHGEFRAGALSGRRKKGAGGKKDRRPIGHCGLPIFARSRQQWTLTEQQRMSRMR